MRFNMNDEIIDSFLDGLKAREEKFTAKMTLSVGYLYGSWAMIDDKLAICEKITREQVAVLAKKYLEFEEDINEQNKNAK